MKKIINSTEAPAPVGPYSHGVLAEGRFLFISGQIPYNKEGQLVGDDIVSQTRQCLKNIKAIVEEAGGSLNDIVKATCLLKDMNFFNEMNQVYSEFLGESKPARAAYEVNRLPKDVLIEIEAIAVMT